MQPHSSRSPFARRRRVAAAGARRSAWSRSAAPQPARAQGLPDFTELVDKVGPAVVNIRTTERGRAPRGGPGGTEMDEDMLEFFRRFGIPAPSRPNPRVAAAARRRAAAARRRLRLHPQRRRLRA